MSGGGGFVGPGGEGNGGSQGTEYTLQGGFVTRAIPHRFPFMVMRASNVNLVLVF